MIPPDPASVLENLVASTAGMSDESVDRRAKTTANFVGQVGIATVVCMFAGLAWMVNFIWVTKPDRDQDRKDRAMLVENQSKVAQSVETLSRREGTWERGIVLMTAKLEKIDTTLKGMADNLHGHSEQLEKNGETLKRISDDQRLTVDVLNEIRQRPRPGPMDQ